MEERTKYCLGRMQKQVERDRDAYRQVSELVALRCGCQPKAHHVEAGYNQGAQFYSLPCKT